MATPRTLLALVPFLLLACAPDGARRPDDGEPAGGYARVEIVGSSDLSIDTASEAVLELRYLDADDQVVPGAVIDLSIEGDAGGASLAAASVQAD